MTTDVYAAWLTAGDTLRPYGDWLAANWLWLTAGLSFAAIAWQIIRRMSRGDDYRTRNDQSAAVWIHFLDPPNRETAPGSDIDDLDACLQILRATDDQAREEKP